jgi:hypothetical protein
MNTDGDFRADALVSWSLGKRAAERRARNCWDNSLRVRHIGT